MAQLGAELADLTIRIDPLAVPRHNRANSDGVTKIVDAWATAVLVEPLRLAQTDLLRHDLL